MKLSAPRMERRLEYMRSRSVSGRARSEEGGGGGGVTSLGLVGGGYGVGG